MSAAGSDRATESDGTNPSEHYETSAGAASSERISAVIACYRDAPAIPIMHERLTAVFTELGVDYEIIFVNDGSPDESREVLRELAARDRRVVVITHTRAFGAQSAFTSGMRLATGDAVVLLDGDLQDPPELIPELVERWREGYEVVYAERADREGRRLKRWATKVFYRLFKRVSYVDVPVDAGDFGLMDRRAVDAHPEQDNLVPEKANPKVLAAVDRLRAGTLMLTQPDEFDAPVKRAGAPPMPSGAKLVRLQRLALDRIRARFRLEEVDRSPSGMVLMRLVPRA